MHIPNLLRQRFGEALRGLTEAPDRFASMIRPTADRQHGDYQSNCAMPLSKQTGGSARDLATDLVSRLKVDDLCDRPEVAGPGFINLRVKDSFLIDALRSMLGDARCGVPMVAEKKTVVIDFSSPNVAKPMHVGHIRSTVIGDALARTYRFLGHHVITDNHLGDWGTQFGIIIYGYKHFGDPDVVMQDPVRELSKLYRLVNQLIEYRKAVKSIEDLRESVAGACRGLDEATAFAASTDDPKEKKKANKALNSAQRRLAAAEADVAAAAAKIEAVESDPSLRKIAQAHPNIDAAVLQETAKLHRDDPENLALWEQFLPHCQDEINRVYARLNVRFDHTLGESFYHSMLGDVVSRLQQQRLATESEGAVVVTVPEYDAPMIVRKQDGAYLYATTDLATLQYRLTEFDPSEILYVVDTRQSEHFNKLFAVAHHFGLQDVKLVHVNFGTVLGEDGRPMKTRSGSLIGLEGLLDDAVARAREVVCQPERLASFDPPMDQAEQETVAEVVGIGAIKFADLSHHRASDYRFNLNKMIALDGDTSTYVQYQVARTQKILANAEMCESDVIQTADREGIEFTHPAERNLALMLVKLEEALQAMQSDYAPNLLVDYLLDTAKAYSKFNDNCHVLRAETPRIKATRLTLVTLTGRVLQLGLGLIGVDVVPRM